MYSFSHQEARPPVQHEGVVDVYGGDSSEADDDGSGGQEEEAEDEGQEDEEQEDEDLASNADIDESAENQENDIDQDEYDDKAEDEIVDMLDLDDDAAPVQDFGGQDEYDETENGLDTMGQPPQDLASDNGKYRDVPCRSSSSCFCNKCIAEWFRVNEIHCESARNSPDINDETRGDKTNVCATSAFENTDFQTDQGTGADGDENAGFDLLDFPDEDATAQPDQANKGNTSATVTLNGDGENEITYEDDAFNGTGNVTGGVAGDGAHGDEFQEIDWRDGPDDDAGVSLDTSIPSKRPHSEVEVDLSVDDENGKHIIVQFLTNFSLTRFRRQASSLLGARATVSNSPRMICSHHLLYPSHRPTGRHEKAVATLSRHQVRLSFPLTWSRRDLCICSETLPSQDYLSHEVGASRSYPGPKCRQGLRGGILKGSTIRSVRDDDIASKR